MGDFAADTDLEGGDGRYRARISPEWKVWGPLGGYVAAIALRAMGRETPLRRPASITCQFLAEAKFEDAEVEVTTLRRGRRSHALHVRMSQRGNVFLAASGWVVDAGMKGLEHEHTRMPDVPGPDDVRSYAEVADTYEDWYPVWHGSIDGKPTHWDLERLPGDPVWRTWMRVADEGATISSADKAFWEGLVKAYLRGYDMATHGASEHLRAEEPSQPLSRSRPKGRIDSGPRSRPGDRTHRVRWSCPIRVDR